MQVTQARSGSIADLAERSGIPYHRVKAACRGGARLSEAESGRLESAGVTLDRRADEKGRVWTLVTADGRTLLYPPEDGDGD